MKKLLKVTICAVSMGLFFFGAASISLAASPYKSAGSPMLTCGATDKLEIGLSPRVQAYYAEDGAGDPPQWYLISTFHEGGTEVYATAQTLTKIYKSEYAPGTTAETVWGTLPTDAKSETLWNAADSGWKP